MDARQISRFTRLNIPPVKALLLASGIALLSACSPGDGTSPEQAAIHLRSSEAYSQQGQFRAALIEARNAIRMAPDRIDGHLQLAGIHNRLGDGRSAARILEPLLEQAPGRTALELAKAWNLQAKYRSTLDLLQRDDLPTGVTGQPRHRLLLAEALGGVGEHGRALELYEQLLAEDAENHEARLGIARVHLLAQDIEPADAALDELLELQPRNVEALFLKAQIAFFQNRLEDAERRLTDALSYLPQTDVITPMKARVLRQLSDTLTQLGRPSEALIYSRLLAEATPGAQEARQRFNDALELFQAGDLEGAERILLDLYQFNPDNDLSGMLLGLVAYEKGEFDSAGQLFQQHVDPETAAPQMVEAAALAQLRLQRPREAIDLLREALRGHEQNANLQAIFGMAALRYPDTREEGALALQKALAIDPSRSRLRIPLANHYLQEGKIEQAEAQLQTAASKSPGDTRVQGGYITYLLNNGDTQRARQVMQTFLQTTPDEVETQLLAGQVAMVTGQLDTARRHYQ